MTCWRACGVASVDFPASAFWIPISLLPAWPSQCILWHASKTVLDVRLYVLGEEVARVTLDGGAISPNQELLKVPGYVGPPHWFPDQEVGAKTFLRSISGWRVRLPRHQTFWVVRRGRQRLFEECEEGMFILSIHLHLSKRRWFLQKRKRYLAPQTSILGLKRYKMVKSKIGESGLPCRTCPPWTRSHCRASHASAGWRSPHRRRSPVQHRLRSNLSSTNPDVGSSHQNRIMLLSWYWKARVWFLSILVTWYRSRSSRCHLI